MNKFVIVAQLRSGYQFLSQLLNSNGHVLCFGEIFGSDKAVRQKSFFGNKISAIEDDEEVVDYINHNLIKYVFKKKVKAFGFKLNYVDCKHNENWAHIWDHIAAHKWKIIHLHRENLLDRLISEKLAHKSNHWAWKPYADTQIEVTFPELEFYRNQSLQWQEWANNHFKDSPMMQLTYEELTGNTEEVCDKVQEFIGVEKRNLWTEMPKQRTGGQATYLSNYRELYRECINHPIFKSYLTDLPAM